MSGALSLLYLPGPVWPRRVVYVRVPSLGQIALFKNLKVYEQMTNVR